MASITGSGVGWRIDHTISARPINVSTAASCSNRVSRRVGADAGAALRHHRGEPDADRDLIDVQRAGPSTRRTTLTPRI